MEAEPIKDAALGRPMYDSHKDSFTPGQHVFVGVGGNGGDEFSFKCLSSSISEISVTYSKATLNTIKVILNTGQVMKVGMVAGSKRKHIVLDGNDDIVATTLWPNIHYTRCGGFEFEVANINGERKSLSVKCDHLGEPVSFDVKSGRCYGIMGRSGDEIDALGFYFI